MLKILTYYNPSTVYFRDLPRTYQPCNLLWSLARYLLEVQYGGIFHRVGHNARLDTGTGSLSFNRPNLLRIFEAFYTDLIQNNQPRSVVQKDLIPRDEAAAKAR